MARQPIPCPPPSTLSGLVLGVDPPCLCRLLHAYQAVAHSLHSKIEIHNLVLIQTAGQRRAESIAGIEAVVLARSLTDLTHTDSLSVFGK
jgi:hypothetical protein